MIIGIVFLFFVALPAVLVEVTNMMNRRAFRKELESSYSINPVKWPHVKILAKNNHIDNKQTKLALEELLCNGLTKKNGAAPEIVAYIDGLLHKVIKDEPFEGIPDNIKIHMEHLREKTDEDLLMLAPLAERLREQSDKQIKEKKFWKLISSLSLLVGVIGAIFGSVPLFYDNTAMNQDVTFERKLLHENDLPNKVIK